MGVIQLKPNLKEGDLTQGYCVPRGSSFFTHIAPGETTRCEFRSGQDVELWPLEIAEARLSSVPRICLIWKSTALPIIGLKVPYALN